MNALPGDSLSESPAVDSTGRYVAFLSTATTLTTNAVAGNFHLYLRAAIFAIPLAGKTILLDAETNGFGFAKDFLNPPRLSLNERFIAFDCSGERPATNIIDQAYNVSHRSLVPNDANPGYDVFLVDCISKSNELISVHQQALPSQTPADAGTAAIFSVDRSGRFIAFGSTAGSLAANDANRYRSVFVHDLLGGTNVLVSADTNGLSYANGMSSDPGMSGDGRYVVFSSSATNLAVADSNNAPGYGHGQDVLLRDLQTGLTTLVSVDASAVYGNNSYSPVISANGRYVLFRSTASIATMTRPSGNRSETCSCAIFRPARRMLNLLLQRSLFYNPLIFQSSMAPDGHFVAVYGTTPFISIPLCMSRILGGPDNLLLLTTA